MTRLSVSSLKSMWTTPIGSSPSTNQLSGTFSKLRGSDGFVSFSEYAPPILLQIQ
ncbi:hypothetical protein A2U01_0115431, partial [Trifolium medium]|nr:hypothetical protein [Trifolium medium]